MSSEVLVRRAPVVLPTYRPRPADKNPMFLEKRVYQGSSGAVYPLPFTDRIAERPEPRTWQAVYLENEYLSVMLLPELGGRIHRATDKVNGYDILYYQPVIKPALVGLAGPWASGGIEFNWPQHHRPSTFMPADLHIERHPDGAVTVWMSEHDPLARMKGMHGVCLHPGRSVMELKVRAYNRSEDVQTFLWWANAAIEVNEHYQSFFPGDVTYVADHARRATSTYPLCSGVYYGVDYARRAREGVPPEEMPRQFVPRLAGECGDSTGVRYQPNDLSWYANIPVPTSYMCMGSKEDFFGGYDHRAQAGLVHIANHHISPGKKQWTWGNQEFGYAWDRNLTDPDERGVYRPYIELMAGVYTDNQPDFSFLNPGETRTWSQFWYPIRSIGPAQAASVDAALSIKFGGEAKGARLRIGVSVTRTFPKALILLTSKGRELFRIERDLDPGSVFLEDLNLKTTSIGLEIVASVSSSDGREILRYELVKRAASPDAQAPAEATATEPAVPKEVVSVDELYLVGLHLEQYRHATRPPQDYWLEGLRRDAGDARCNLALGRWHLRRGEFAESERHLRASIARLTQRNANPYDGEAFYQLGRCLRHQALVMDSGVVKRGDTRRSKELVSEAYDVLYKATWNQAWQAPAFHALAEIDCERGAWDLALEHLERSLRVGADNLRARNLKVIVLRRLGRDTEAGSLLEHTLVLDPLDWWARQLRGDKLACDTQLRLDLALDHARAGLLREAIDLLLGATPEDGSGTAPMVHYYLAWLYRKLGDDAACASHLAEAAAASPEYCFPARLEEIGILQMACEAAPADARAPHYLGNLLYARRRHREAIACWERAVRLEPGNAVAWRNLGIGAFNILGKPSKARAAYEKAFRANPADARLLFERDQLWKRLGLAPYRRLRELLRHPKLVALRDDLSVEVCALHNQTGHPELARDVLASRRFQPWEGGEGQALGQHVRTHVLLGRAALARGEPDQARALLEQALHIPDNLAEARHLLANQSDLHYWLGEACAAAGDRTAAVDHWTRAATFKGDFQEMRVRNFSEMSYYTALALIRLGRKAKAGKLLKAFLVHARGLARLPAKIDYFATSLPTMLLFDDDLQARQTTTARFLEAQALLGLGRKVRAQQLLAEVLKRDPSHALAADLFIEV